MLGFCFGLLIEFFVCLSVPTSILLLLATAKKVPTNSVKFQKFEKTGGSYQAQIDYLALNPTFQKQQVKCNIQTV